MSRDSLVWRPTPPEPPPVDSLPDQLTHLLVTWLRGQDPWSPWDGKPGRQQPATLDNEQRVAGFLEGLAASGVEGAADLLAALEQHGSIDLWWEE